MNRIFKQLAAVLLALVLLAGTALAALPDRLIPGGQAIGLQLQTDGVSIVELAQDLGLGRTVQLPLLGRERLPRPQLVQQVVHLRKGDAASLGALAVGIQPLR